MTTADIIIAILGAGGLASIIPKIVDGIKAWRTGKASEEKQANRAQLGRIFTAERERDNEANFRRRIEEWAGELIYMLKQIGVPNDKIPPKPLRKDRANA